VAEGKAAVAEGKDADESDVNDPGTFLDEYLFITRIFKYFHSVIFFDIYLFIM
jgi:hypothetical protein